ncbi:MAG: hypothetical protein IBX61_02680 [Thermoleophilia bacterium]|nr:hypothetical protein [Thermoleophilia bacterium]
MESTALMFYIEPGMTPECLKFAEEAMGPRRAEHDESRRRLGITAEKVWIENTNEGDVMIFYLESNDIAKSLAMIGESDHVYDLWFREKIFELTGIDLCDYRTVSGTELAYESPRLEPRGPSSSVAAVFPLLPGMKEEWLAMLEVRSGPRREEYLDYLSRHGFSLEKLYVQPTRKGERVILYVEGDDPAGAIARFARSNHPFDVWIREEMLRFNGIDFIRRETAPPPHSIMDWHSEAKPMAA